MNRRDRRAAAAADPRLRGAEIRYDGRTLELRVYVNTDLAPEVVHAAVVKAVRSCPGEPMCIVTASHLTKEESIPLWEATIEAMHDHVEREPQKN